LRAVFFGEYFQIRGNAPVRDAALRYPSNKLMVARCLAELAPDELDHFTFIEPSVPMERDREKENATVHLEWPDSNSPIWTGISALEEMRTNTAWPNADNFVEKERDDIGVRSRSADMSRLKNRMGVAESIAKYSVLEKLPKEPWNTQFFGRGLPSLVAAAHSLAKRNPTLGISGLTAIARLTQAQYAQHWLNIWKIFPALEVQNTNPASIRESAWGTLRSESASLTKSQDDLLSGTGALILHAALRGGRL
jgi:hypothetical protein